MVGNVRLQLAVCACVAGLRYGLASPMIVWVDIAFASVAGICTQICYGIRLKQTTSGYADVPLKQNLIRFSHCLGECVCSRPASIGVSRDINDQS